MTAQPIHIEKETLYTGPQTKDLLRGFVSLDTLRRYGLRGRPGGGPGGGTEMVIERNTFSIVGHVTGLKNRSHRGPSCIHSVIFQGVPGGNWCVGDL